ncbi:hypothetical protein [Noviherbaspirillum sp. Root189]|uniref:hypothetical protein n=1 Tax=Noviherbaspirillum sp. Root189 TaxID=1736487 RepID=UPI0012E35B97|nr:hypothetical protein [Noviherbaspirillum sp. Root189]
MKPALPTAVMDRIGKGYTPQVTPLTHERAYIGSRTEDEQMTPPDNGGWNVETKVFEAVRNYQALNKFDYDDKRFLFIPLWRLFLDAFTAGVENGYLHQANWKSAFRFSDDWLALATELIESETVWLNERHRRATSITMLDTVSDRDAFQTYAAIGWFLKDKVDWNLSRPGLRLV